MEGEGCCPSLSRGAEWGRPGAGLRGPEVTQTVHHPVCLLLCDPSLYTKTICPIFPLSPFFHLLFPSSFLLLPFLFPILPFHFFLLVLSLSVLIVHMQCVGHFPPLGLQQRAIQTKSLCPQRVYGPMRVPKQSLIKQPPHTQKTEKRCDLPN